MYLQVLKGVCINNLTCNLHKHVCMNPSFLTYIYIRQCTIRFTDQHYIPPSPWT
ncbi:hypothetical protein Hanom_Chr09g00848351 [Helianthus anomalus]